MNTSPILPDKRIKKCLIGEAYTNEINDLYELGIECITLAPNKALDNEINCHADILSFNCGNGVIFADESIAGELTDVLTKDAIIAVSDIKSPYPNDIKLNAAFLGDKLLCNKKYIANEILDFCKNQKIEVINTKQGYSKCSVCVLNEKAVITEDSGIAYLLKNCQIDVLEITPGNIFLSEKHNGFVGGASAKISANELYFSGNPEEHPDYLKIIRFLDKYNIKPIYNKNRHLCDFGGIIQIYDK